jgi:hypothetical protein
MVSGQKLEPIYGILLQRFRSNVSPTDVYRLNYDWPVRYMQVVSNSMDHHARTAHSQLGDICGLMR